MELRQSKAESCRGEMAHVTEAPASRASRLDRVVPAWLDALSILHGLVLVAGFAFYLRISRHQWFFGDDWDFVTVGRAARPWVDEYLGPHNEHWVTVPLLLFRAAEGLFGLESYLPFMLPVIAAHIALAHVLWRFMVRIGVVREIAFAGSTLFVFLPSAHENLLWAFQIAFVGPILLGFIAILLIDHPGPWNGRDWAAAVILLVSLGFSGLSIPMIVVAAALEASRRGLLAATGIALVPAAAYLWWWSRFHGDTIYAARSVSEFLYSLDDFVAMGLTAAVEQTLGYASSYSAGAGFVIVLILAAALARHTDDLCGSAIVAVLCLGGAVAMLGLVAYGRVQLGPGQAAAPRYVYCISALLLPAVALSLTWLVGRSRSGAWVVAAALLALAAQGVLTLRASAAIEATREQSIERVLAAASTLVATGMPVDPRAQPEPKLTQHVTVGDLQRLRGDGLLVSTAYDEGDRLTAEANLLVGVSSVALPGTVAQEGGCRVSLGETLTVEAPTVPTSYLVDAPEAAVLSVRLGNPETGAQGQDRELGVPTGRSYVTVLVAERRIQVGFADRRHVAFCG